MLNWIIFAQKPPQTLVSPSLLGKKPPDRLNNFVRHSTINNTRINNSKPLSRIPHTNKLTQPFFSS